MNWGIKIFLAFLAFVVFLGILIYRVYQANMDLVAPDYYQQELVFQDHIDKINNERSLKRTASIEHDAELKRLLISFPADVEIASAKVALYRPSDADLDLKWQLKLDQNNSQVIPIERLARGLWQVKLEWQDQSKGYLKEQNIYLP